MTRGLLELLDAAELRPLLAHELAHLAEPRAVHLLRASTLPSLPALGLAPALWTAVHPLAAAAPLLLVVVAVVAVARRTKRSEEHADATANAWTDPAAGARGLLALHRAQLLPAVMPKGEDEHPDLYDRLLAAGVQPGFERPDPPPKPSRRARLAVFVAAIAPLGGNQLASFAGWWHALETDRGWERQLAWRGGGAWALLGTAEAYAERGERDAAHALLDAATMLGTRKARHTFHRRAAQLYDELGAPVRAEVRRRSADQAR